MTEVGLLPLRLLPPLLLLLAPLVLPPEPHEGLFDMKSPSECPERFVGKCGAIAPERRRIHVTRRRLVRVIEPARGATGWSASRRISPALSKTTVSRCCLWTKAEKRRITKMSQTTCSQVSCSADPMAAPPPQMDMPAARAVRRLFAIGHA